MKGLTGKCNNTLKKWMQSQYASAKHSILCFDFVDFNAIKRDRLKKCENIKAVNRRRADNTITKRRRTDDTITKRRRRDNTITKRRRTDNTITKKRTDNTITKRRRTNNTITKRKRTNNKIQTTTQN